MNRPIRKISIVVGILLLAVVINLNWVQVIHGDSYRNNPANRRVQLDQFKRPRGSIIAGGTALAESVASSDTLGYLRRYPDGSLYAAVTGFDSLYYGQTGIESAEDNVLSGSDDRLFAQRLSDLLTGRDPRGGNVLLTINKQAQAAAAKALGNRRGAVVALDPTTGAILAAYSSPSYDPNKLSSHSADGIQAAYNSYNADKNQPLLNRAFDATYPPGSVFKVIVSAAAVKAGKTPSSTIPAPNSYTPPGTTTAIRNFDGETCGNGKTDSLDHALTISCNTAFAELGVTLGASAISNEAKLFGIDDNDFTNPLRVAGSSVGTLSDSDQAALAQSSIGQRDVRITPLEGAMIAATVANRGTLMKPYLVSEEQGPDLAVLSKTSPQVQSVAMTPAQASQVTTMMTHVVSSGTGTAAQIAGITVAGKTGTADNGPTKADGSYVNAPHAWFAGFAPAAAPKIAVSVIIENGGVAGNETTGGLAAAPVAKAVIQAYLGSGGGK